MSEWVGERILTAREVGEKVLEIQDDDIGRLEFLLDHTSKNPGFGVEIWVDALPTIQDVAEAMGIEIDDYVPGGGWWASTSIKVAGLEEKANAERTQRTSLGRCPICSAKGGCGAKR
jgi:hypothetical protein